MKTLVIMVVAWVLVVPPVLAQTPVIGVHAHLSDCQLYSYVGEIQSVWVALESGPWSVEAARFRVEVVNNGWTAVYIGAYYPVIYVTPPDPFTGGTFALPDCLGQPFVRLDYLALSPSPECAADISVVPDPAAASGQIEVIECGGNVLFAQSGTTVVVNPNADTCPCVIGPVAAEQSTWGQIKALYR
jgi:hypothetical protein